MQKTMVWVEAHKSDLIEFVRMYLGGVLLFKGLFFIQDIDKLTALMGGETVYMPLAIAHYIVFAHIVGGIFLTIGFLTRVVVLFQIPVLLGAVFLVHFKQGLFSSGSSLEFALMVLLLLVAFMFYGSGRLSVDYYLDNANPH